MKINYNGQELETITEGYWPEGVTLAQIGGFACETTDVVCLCNGRVLTKRGTTASAKEWAVLPPKPAQRRLTNKEAFGLCRKGWDVLYRGDVAISFIYPISEENNEACEYCEKLRAPGSDEWVEPTTDLLEVEK